MSENKPPQPVSKGLLVCRDVYQDVNTKEYILIGPVLDMLVAQFPFIAAVSVFGQLTSLHGCYRLKLQVEDGEGAVVWSQDMPTPLENSNPLMTVRVSFLRLPVYLPRPGKYDMVLLANAVEVARYSFVVDYTKPPAAAGPAVP